VCTLLCTGLSPLRRASFTYYTLYVAGSRLCGASQIECKLFRERPDIVRKTIKHPCCYFLATAVFSQECRRRRMYSSELITCPPTHWFSPSIDWRDPRFNVDKNDNRKKKYPPRNNNRPPLARIIILYGIIRCWSD